MLGKNIICIRRDKISIFARANLAPCKGIQDSLGFWIPHHGFGIPGSLSVVLEFRIPIVSGIPDSLNCILDSKAQDSGFHKQKFPGFTNPDSLTWGDKLFFFHYIFS